MNNSNMLTLINLENNSLLGNIFGLIKQIVIITDNQGKFLSISSNIEKILGINKEKVYEYSYINNFLPNLKFHREHLRKKNLLKNIETEIKIEQKETQYLLVDIQFIEEEDAKLIYIITNITEQKKEKEQLLSSEKVYINMVESLPIGVFRLDSNGNFLYANSQAKKMMRITPENPFFAGWLENIDKADKEKIFLDLTESLKTRKIWKDEYKYQNSLGVTQYFLTQGIPENNNFRDETFLGTVIDITERKIAEKLLKESEEKFRETFEQAAVGIAHVANDGSWLKVNQKLCSIVGYSYEELLNLTFQDITYQDDLKIDLDYVRACLKGEIDTYSMEKRYLKKDGNIVWINLTVKLLRDTFNNPKYFISVVENIDNRKQIELELSRSEERFRSAVMNAPFPIMLHAEDGEVVKINQAWTDISGYQHEDISSISDWTKKAYGERKNLVKKDIDNLYKIKQRKHEGEYYINTANGEIIVWDFSSAPLGKLSDGRKFVISMAKDITKRKQAEEAYLKLNEELEKKVQERTEELDKSKQFLQLIIDNIPQHIFWKNRHSIYLGCNKIYAQAIEFKNASEIIGKNDYDLPFLAQEAKLYQEWDFWVMTHNCPRFHIIESITINDHKMWFDTSKIPLQDSQGNVVGVLGSYVDITERKKLEENLKITQFTLDKLGESVFFVKEDGTFFYVNEAACQKLGYSQEELISLNIQDINSYFNEGKNWLNLWAKLSREKSLVVECNHQTKTGFLFPVEISLYPLNFDTKSYTCVVARDITERKNAELALQESEKKYRQIVETATEGIWIINRENNTSYVNKKMTEMLGYSSSEMMGKSLLNFMDEEEKTIAIEKLNRRHQGIKEQHDFKFTRKDGSFLWCIISTAPILDENGDYNGALGMITDISERLKTEEALKYSEEKFRRTLKNSPIVVFNQDINLRYTWVYNHPFGLKSEDMIGKLDYDIFSLEDAQKLTSLKQKVLNKKQKIRKEIKINHKNTLKYFDLTIEPLFNSNHQLEGITCIALDITDRKKTELELQKSQNFIENITNTSPNILYIFDLETQSNIYCNHSIAKILGFKENEIQKMKNEILPILIHPEDLLLINEHHQQLKQAKNQEILNIEYRIKDIQGNWHWFASHDKIFSRDKKGNVTQILGAASDITAKKKYEFTILHSLKEKEVLLKEIHHRVKNNLYVISSLLNLQSGYFDDEKVKTCFQDSKNRIQSMAMIHEQLYRSNNLAAINFSDYINPLVNSIISSYNPFPDTIKSEINVEPICLDIEIAVPCGLLVNELVTNSFKHGFKSIKSGKVIIKLYRDDQQQIHLIVTDTGQGFSSEIDWESANTLGLRLVRILTEQIDGSLDFKTSENNGTSFHVTFN